MSRKNFMRVVLGFVLCATSLFAQRAPQGVPRPRGLDQPSPTRPDSIQDSGLYGWWTDTTNQSRVGGALLGKVVVEGETLPWEPIVVNLRCKNSTIYNTETDPKGNFAVMPNHIPGELSQLGDRQRQMEVHLEGCTLEAYLSGFRSSQIAVTEHNLRDDPEVGTIKLSRASANGASALSVTSHSAPRDALKHWSNAGVDLMNGKADHARQELEKAVRIYPAFAEAWYELGRLQMPSAPADAKASFEKSVAADPEFVRPYQQLASLFAEQGDWESVVDSTNHFLKLDPQGTIRIWYYAALGNFQLAHLDVAEADGKKLLAADPLHNVRNGEQLLAVILARKADYAGAIEHLRNCLTYVTGEENVALLKQQIAQLEQRVLSKN